MSDSNVKIRLSVRRITYYCVIEDLKLKTKYCDDRAIPNRYGYNITYAKRFFTQHIRNLLICIRLVVMTMTCIQDFYYQYGILSLSKEKEALYKYLLLLFLSVLIRESFLKFWNECFWIRNKSWYISSQYYMHSNIYHSIK